MKTQTEQYAPPLPPWLAAACRAPEATDAYRDCFEAVARSVRLREAEAARAALARRVVGVDYDAVPMIPLSDWMVGR